jgi:type IX secretion system PorP/SprF family membrane protein
MDNPVPLNPAYSLTNDHGNISFTAHKQWLGISGAPTLFIFNTDFPSLFDNTKAGIIASENTLGVEQLSQASGFFAKSIHINEVGSLGVAISGGFKYYTTAYAPLDPHDPAIQNDIQQFTPVVGLSAVYYGDDFYAGFSIPDVAFHSSSTLLDNNNFRNHYYLTGGLTSELNEDFSLKPAFLAYVSRGIPVSVDGSLKLAIKKTIAVGFNYTSSKELAALFSLDEDSFHFGYSYQFGVSNTSVSQFTNATQEITLTFFFGKGNQTPINPGGK